MLIGRSAELNQLNQYYEREGSQILVVYGQKNMGKTTLLKSFAADKPGGYYAARSCSEREQQYCWGAELSRVGKKLESYPSFTEILRAVTTDVESKQVLIVDEFQYIIKTSPSFMKELVSFVHGQKNGELLVILVSSSVGWVENSMLRKIGECAYELSGLMKIKQLKFADLEAFFPDYTMEQRVQCYAILGGLPGLWAQFDRKLSLRENMIQKILPPSSSLSREAVGILTEELRETAVYNTILAAIAEGRNKLNDLYRHTGFSRAKISVYLKNLMELEIVEKVFSFETEGKNNTQKGIYRICDHFVCFYFRFLYPRLSSLHQVTAEEFYWDYVEEGLNPFVAEFFGEVCREYLDGQNERGKLPLRYVKSGEWVGKAGKIDIVARDEEGHTLVALCVYERGTVTYEDYKKLLACAEKAKLQTDYIYLFSMDRFDDRLVQEAGLRKNLNLFSLGGKSRG